MRGSQCQIDAVRVDAGESHSLARAVVAGGVAVASVDLAPGKARACEDVAAIVPTGGDTAVLLVADGMGGHSGGAQAARITVEALVEHLRCADAPVRERILHGLEAANRQVLAQSTGSGCTLAAAEIGRGTLRSYHVGDAEVLAVGQRGKVRHRSISHAPVAYAQQAGMLSEREALAHADRHLVSNAVGAEDMRIEIGPELSLSRRDTVLVASDGIFDNLLERELVELIRKGPIDDVGHDLRAAVLARMTGPRADEPCKPDDVGFVLWRAEV